MDRNETDRKTELFERAAIPKAVMTMAVPTIISSLVMVLYNLADTYFVSLLNDPIQNAAVTLAAPVLLSFNAVNNLFGVGSSSLMSRALGKKDYEAVRRASALGFSCALACGVLFSAGYLALQNPLLTLLGADGAAALLTRAYLNWTTACGAVPAIVNVVLAYLVRSEGASLHASIGTMSGCLLNIFLDPVFILPWGLDLGASGAGLATFLSNCVACGYFFVLLYRKRGRTYVCVAPSMLRPDRKLLAAICVVGVPAAIQNLLNVTGMTVLNNFTAAYGSDAVAAMGIAQKINMIPLYIALGLSQGVMPLVGYNYSGRNLQRMKEAVSFSLKLALGFMLAASACYYLTAGKLMALFMKNGTIIFCGSRFLRGLCLGLPFLCVDFLAVGVFQACGLGRKALVFALLRKIALEIPALFLLDRLWPMYGLAYAQLSAELALSCAAVYELAKLFREAG